MTAVVLVTGTLGFAAGDERDAAPTEPGVIGEDLADRIAATDGEVRVLVEVAGEAPALRDRAERAGLEVRYAYDHIPVLAGSIHADLVQDLADEAWVEEIEHDAVMKTRMDVSRVETMAPQANAAGWDGEGVNVAVVDTGIEKTHPALEGRITGCVKIEAGVHYPTCEDDNGHGTHVAGTIGAQPTATESDIVGVAPQVTFSAVKVLNAAGAGLTSDVIAGMQWVIDNKDTYGIEVMSMSLGGETCGDGTSDAAQMADQVVEAGIVAVIAAGNEGDGECSVTVPGTAEKVVTVGAVDDFATKNYEDDHVAGFSSRGPTADGRTKPDVVAPGVGITSTYIGGTYATLDGTSMATPHVSGVVANLLEQDPTLTPGEVKTQLHSTAIELPGTVHATPNNDVGWGFVGSCDLLALNDCSQPAELTDVHVGSVDQAWSHYAGGDGHRVETTVGVLDGGGNAVAQAGVHVTTTAPDGTAFEDGAKTGSDGTATVKAQQKSGGHGTWEGCVDALWGQGLRYTPSADAETCETISVSH